ncbi:sodium-dependent transporter [Candidatus Fermentibacteria bacterium]|nr:sodium-dependent transporter [Candidatus Fermentibacteria bacterium]
MQENPAPRAVWSSKLGFILAASGSAIGLGNIVFFGANAYKYGAGAFYVPYLLALFFVGLPFMAMEIGLGLRFNRALPESLHLIAGRRGEFVGWWGILNASVITTYYIAILGWVVGMLIGAFGPLWKPSLAVPAFNMAEGAIPNPFAYFFNMLSTPGTLLFVVLAWVLNIIIVWKGTLTIEKAVKVCVPLMWVFMLILIVRGLTLPNGSQGVRLLFTPNWGVMRNPDVWKGAFGQIFFSLSLGFGIMTAYASYLPKKSDCNSNAMMVSFLNCGFEFIAGVAIFTILFSLSIVPKASTLAMSFFVLPSGIARFPYGVATFGVMFFTLLLLAGISSSVSLVEALASSVIDKFRISRIRALLFVGSGGVVLSLLFALPMVVDASLKDNGTLGLTLLDLSDHWAFGYGLLAMGLAESILIGWVLGAGKLRETMNANARIRLGPWFDVLVRFVAPAVVLAVIVASIAHEVKTGMYGSRMVTGWRPMAAVVLLAWLLFTSGGAFLLSAPQKGKGVRA